MQPLNKLLNQFPPLRRWQERDEREIVAGHINQMTRSLNELYARRREEAIHAVIQKNNLQNQVNELKKTQANEEVLLSVEAALQQSKEICEQIKASIRNEEEEIR